LILVVSTTRCVVCVLEAESDFIHNSNKAIPELLNLFPEHTRGLEQGQESSILWGKSLLLYARAFCRLRFS